MNIKHISSNLNLISAFILFIFFTNTIFAQNPLRDTTFGGNGFKRTILGPSNEDANSIVVQPDGKIIAGGTQTDSPTFGPQRFALVRYQNNGDFDSTFGTNGVVLSEFLSQNWCNVIQLLDDGKILAAGQASTGFCIARYSNDGSLDSSFGTGGTTMMPAVSGSGINDMKVFSNGKIIVVGSNAIPGSRYEMKMAMLDSIGMIDSTFGLNGTVTSTLGYISAIPGSVLIQPDNKIVIGGRVTFDNGGNTVTQMFLARYHENGLPDSTYGVDGIYSGSIGMTLNDMVFDVNGNIVAVGEIGTNQQGTSGDICVMRFASDGFPDSTFGTNGSTHLSEDSYADYANAVCMQQDGKILVGGSFFNFGGGSTTDCLVLRVLENGMRDTTFGDNGAFWTGVTSGTDRILDMALTPDNKIAVCGTGNFSVNFDFVVGRLIMDMTVTGLTNIGDQEELFIYPNPSTGSLNVRSPSKGNSEIHIYNLFGQSVYEGRFTSGEFIRLNISNIQSGTYILRIEDGTKKYVRKFEVIN